MADRSKIEDKIEDKIDRLFSGWVILKLLISFAKTKNEGRSSSPVGYGIGIAEAVGSNPTRSTNEYFKIFIDQYWTPLLFQQEHYLYNEYYMSWILKMSLYRTLYLWYAEK